MNKNEFNNAVPVLIAEFGRCIAVYHPDVKIRKEASEIAFRLEAIRTKMLLGREDEAMDAFEKFHTELTRNDETYGNVGSYWAARREECRANFEAARN